MKLTLSQKQTIQKMAQLLYEFLPGKPYPYADQSVSFLGVANDIGVGEYWMGGSKTPAIVKLLEGTLQYKSDKFCKLITEIVSRSILYRSKNVTIYRETIEELNNLIKDIGFKIPELWDHKFLDSLPRRVILPQADDSKRQYRYDDFRFQLMEILKLAPQPRGYAFESFLNELFKEFGLEPRSPFRIIGEQIDGSIQLYGEIYLLEAKWCNKPIDNTDLLAFKGKVDEKSSWTRGLFISHSGFSQDALTAFSKGKATSIIGLSGEDIYYFLDNNIPLYEIIRKKVRIAAETGEFYTPVYIL